jgi:signal transduction histidine kinase/DNA-binding NarL/FixJ family response regulator
MVVEDELLVALDIEKRLEGSGYVVTTARTGTEAVEQAARLSPDLVLMDIKLTGEMDGIEAARRIRARSEVPIVYLTAFADPATLDRARVTEPYGYILKPFEQRELNATIEMALYRHQAERRRREQAKLQEFLAVFSEELARSLDYQQLVRVTARLLVPEYADWCLVCVRGSGESIPEFTFAFPTDDRAAAATHGTHCGELVRGVMHTGRSELIVNADPRWLGNALGSAHAEVLRRERGHSLVCAALRARQRALGAIALVAGGGHRPYAAEDLALAQDLATRLALAIDNALLYRDSQRAARLREEMLAVVSHDLRNPLSSILLRASELARGQASRHHAESIHRAGKRMDRLIADLLDSASIEAGRLSINPAVHSASVLAHDAVEGFLLAADDKKIALAVCGDENEDQLVFCDRDRILQVLSNLIGNALAFTYTGGSITVELGRAGDYVEFSVRDTGRGIPPEHREHLFDRYWRAPESARPGAGLGLYIAKGIVEAHGGNLCVESTLGVGSTFRFTLPTTRAAAQTEVPATSPDP